MEVRGQFAERSWLSPSTMWVPGIELRLSGLATSAFTCWGSFLTDPGAVPKRPQVIPPHTKVKPHWQHTVPKCSNPSTAASHRTWKVVTNCRTLIGNQSPADSNAHNDCRNGCSGIHKKNMTDMLILLCSYRKQLGYKTTVANCDRVPSEFPFKLRRPHFGETCCVYHLSELAVPP